ncbi:MAG: hypothetical protein D6680_10290 [Cyanobacteria bacterium J007]|nr:MAG: hypothetical protein D6680_10290 [Cyanobacteria bacterium J007]
MSEIEIAVSLIRRDLNGFDPIFEFLFGKSVAIANPVRVLELSQDKGFPRVTEEGYSGSRKEAIIFGEQCELLAR